MKTPKYSLFFDNHTMKACPDVGANFDAKKFVAEVKSCGVDFLTFHARCNQGFAYYDTKIGIRHPSLKHDMFGELAEECRKNKILLNAYINVGISHEEGLLHPDWVRITQEGKIYALNANKDNAGFMTMCPSNPEYVEHVIKMALEVLERYPVSGFFFDCMNPKPCICQSCMSIIKKEGIDWNSWKDLFALSSRTHLAMARKMIAAIKKVKPDAILFFNGFIPSVQQEISDYLDLECLPTGGWGYDNLAVCTRYLRNFGKPTLHMTGRFHTSWGDFGGLRTPASLEYDCFHALANGLRPNIGSHFHPRGDINAAEFHLARKVFYAAQKYEKWYDGAKPQTDIAIFFEPHWERMMSGPAIDGVTRMLAELKCQFDIVSDWEKILNYKLLILPDETAVNPETAELLRRFVSGGGKIIASYRSGLNENGTAFAMSEWGVEYVGEDTSDPVYLQLDYGFFKELPTMPLATYCKGLQVKNTDGQGTFAKVIAPYYNQGFDGSSVYAYTPPDKLTEKPAIILKTDIAYFAFPIFSAYYENAYPYMKYILREVMSKLLPEPLLRTENLPSFGRATVTCQPDRRMVHLLAYVPELRGKHTEMIEEPCSVTDATIAIRRDGQSPTKVYLAPDGKELPFTVKNNYICVDVPAFKGYAVIVFEN
jgi:hypothetical protein